ncbi:MAG: 23S rRNA (pseudouridine(1915)-N(3))-methyltransferase RlmH [Acidobacteriota bacterium]
MNSRRLIVAYAGRHQRPAWKPLYDDYRTRIERDLPVEERFIKVRGSSEDPGRLRAEGAALLAALPDPCWTFALDASGKRFDSPGFAARLAQLRREWPHPVAFLIGSDLGLHAEVLKGARGRLSLGSMILGHELARLVLYEQIYRALAIEKGSGYHRA